MLTDDIETLSERLWNEGATLLTHALKPEYLHIMRQAGIRAGMRVLDIGCGDGAKTALLREFGATAIGLDITETPDVIADATQSLPFPDQAFDAVYMGNGFIDLYLPPTLDEIRRVSRGIILLETTNVLPFSLYAWDRAFQSRVEAAYWRGIMDTDYGDYVAETGDSYERRFLQAVDYLHLTPLTVTASIRQSKTLEDYLTLLFICQVAPLVEDKLSADDWDYLQRLYDANSPDYLFARRDMLITIPILSASTPIDAPPR